MNDHIGLILYGNCNGFFGRDSYEPKRIEALGTNWVVVIEKNGKPKFASFNSTKEMNRYLKLWNSL